MTPHVPADVVLDGRDATTPGASTMNALTTLPRVSSGEGTTAALATALWPTRQFSISDGPIR
jgi:hypothetical protein